MMTANMITHFSLRLLSVLLLSASTLAAQDFENKPADPSFAKFQPLRAPTPAGLVLKNGDRLAICGDSITEQKMYSRIMETYLTVCVPELEVTVRQYGWSGEWAPGFLGRMTNDCLRFDPTLATTCYGMNDHAYKPYDDATGRGYRENSSAIVQAFKAHGVRVILGSPGCVGKVPGWSKTTNATLENLNLSLCELRNINVGIARSENVGFADVFWPMLTRGFDARKQHGEDFAIAGKDGVHPGWAGQVVMAYAFLKAMGLDGDLGTFTVDLAKGEAKSTAGHQVAAFKDGELQITSQRYPFCPGNGDVSKDNNLAAGMALVPFNQELNRLTLVVQGGSAERFQVTWGTETKSFSKAQLAAGINLAETFPVNPFSDAFAKVDSAVAAKQNYETRQIKDLFHGPEGKADCDLTATLTEKVRAPLAAAIKKSFKPVSHTIKIATE